MASESQSGVVLLPIKPEYANAIFTGEKRVEFRKKEFGRPVSHIVVYSSSPEKKVLGYFKISFVDVANPMTAWHDELTDLASMLAYVSDGGFGSRPNKLVLIVGREQTQKVRALIEECGR